VGVPGSGSSGGSNAMLVLARFPDTAKAKAVASAFTLHYAVKSLKVLDGSDKSIFMEGR
jgi:hypothetical protein